MLKKIFVEMRTPQPIGRLEYAASMLLESGMIAMFSNVLLVIGDRQTLWLVLAMFLVVAALALYAMLGLTRSRLLDVGEPRSRAWRIFIPAYNLYFAARLAWMAGLPGRPPVQSLLSTLMPVQNPERWERVRRVMQWGELVLGIVVWLLALVVFPLLRAAAHG